MRIYLASKQNVMTILIAPIGLQHAAEPAPWDLRAAGTVDDACTSLTPGPHLTYMVSAFSEVQYIWYIRVSSDSSSPERPLVFVGLLAMCSERTWRAWAFEVLRENGLLITSDFA